MDKVSIIVPVYKVEAYLEKCIQSLLNQTHGNCEFIFVDDGSPDRSADILERYAGLDNRVRVLHQKNSGVSAARNLGLQASTGDYIAFVDADDWLDETAIETALGFSVENNLDIVLWPYYSEYAQNSIKRHFLGDSNRIWDESQTPSLMRRIIGPYREELDAPHQLDSCVTIWGKLYRRSVVEGIRFLPMKQIGVEDAVYNIEAFSRARRAGYLTDCYSHYRKSNESSITTSYKSDLISRWKGLYQWIGAFLDRKGASQDFYEALSNRVCLHMIGIGLNELGNPAGFFKKAKNLRTILRDEPWHSAFKTLDFQYFPLKWKVFFWLCKHRQTELLLLMLYTINALKSILKH